MAPVRVPNTELSALDSQLQSPTQGLDAVFLAVPKDPLLSAPHTTPSSPHCKAPLTKDATVVADPPSVVPSTVPGPTATPAKEKSTSLLNRIRRSRLLAPFMAERVVKEVLVLPPPIHRVYRRLTAATATTMPQGDVYSFTFSPQEEAQLRAQQRRYLHRQRASPYAPQLVNLDDVADTLLHECEIDGGDHSTTSTTTTTATGEAEVGYVDAAETADPATTTSERVAELLSIFCTRGIPQDEYIGAVFQFRMGVLQKTHKATPVGVVVPSLVHAEVRLRDAVTTQQCTKDETTSKTTGQTTAVSACEPTVTYPHPGTPYTFDDLARDPVLLSAEERLERRTALLHRRTLSEDLYGTPTRYMQQGKGAHAMRL